MEIEKFCQTHFTPIARITHILTIRVQKYVHYRAYSNIICLETHGPPVQSHIKASVTCRSTSKC